MCQQGSMRKARFGGFKVYPRKTISTDKEQKPNCYQPKKTKTFEMRCGDCKYRFTCETS